MIKQILFVLLTLVLLLTACFQDRKSEVIEVPETQFAIYVYLYENGYSETADYVISDEDIVQYDWSQQTLVLDSSLKHLYETDNKFLRDLSRYTVTLDNAPIFQGEFLFFFSARRLETPLIYTYVLEEDMFPTYGDTYPEYVNGDDFLRIQFRPESYITNFQKTSTFPVDDPMIQEQVRQHFMNLNKLGE